MFWPPFLNRIFFFRFYFRNVNAIIFSYLFLSFFSFFLSFLFFFFFFWCKFRTEKSAPPLWAAGRGKVAYALKCEFGAILVLNHQDISCDSVYHQIVLAEDRQLSTIKIDQAEGRQLSTIKSDRQRVDNCPPSN